MFLKNFVLTLSFGLFAINAFAATTADVSKTPITISAENAQKVEALLQEFSTQDLNQLTISKVEELTGKEMSFKEKVAFKIAKMKMKKAQKKAVVLNYKFLLSFLNYFL